MALDFDLTDDQHMLRKMVGSFRLTELAGEMLLLTLAAQLTTLPLLTYYFRSISLVSLLANMVILPVQPALMIVGGLAMLAGMVWLPAGQVLAWAALPISWYTVSFIQWFADFPAASVALGDVAPWAVAAFYLALGGLTWLLDRPAEERPAWWRSLAGQAPERLGRLGLAGMALLTLTAWSWHFSLPSEPGLDPLRLGAMESRIEAYKWLHLAATQGYCGSLTACQRLTLTIAAPKSMKATSARRSSWSASRSSPNPTSRIRAFEIRKCLQIKGRILQVCTTPRDLI